jgi:DNA replication protein DnaC
MNNSIRPCKTIISTNIEVKDLYKYYDERTVSRIIGSYALLKFAGDDLRILKKSMMR